MSKKGRNNYKSSLIFPLRMRYASRALRTESLLLFFQWELAVLVVSKISLEEWLRVSRKCLESGGNEHKQYYKLKIEVQINKKLIFPL